MSDLNNKLAEYQELQKKIKDLKEDKESSPERDRMDDEFLKTQGIDNSSNSSDIPLPEQTSYVSPALTKFFASPEGKAAATIANSGAGQGAIQGMQASDQASSVPSPDTSDDASQEIDSTAPMGAATGAVAGTTGSNAPERDTASDVTDTSNSTPLTPPIPTVNTVANLKAAQEAANNGAMIGRVGQSLNLLTAGIVGQGAKPVGNDVLEGSIKDAQALPGQVQALGEQEKNDPSSPASRDMRKYISNLTDKSVSQDMTFNQGAQLFPMIAKNIDKAESHSLKLQQLTENAQAKADKLAEEKRQHDMNMVFHKMALGSASTKADTKHENDVNKDFEKMGLAAAAGKQSSRSAYGKATLNEAASDRILQMIVGRNVNDLNDQELKELARNLDSLLSQGQATVTGASGLVPRTLVGDSAKLAQYIDNNRHGAQAGSFINQMLSTVRREKALAQQQQSTYRQQIAPGFQHLYAEDPDRYNAILGTPATSEVATIPQNTNSAPLSKDDQDAIDWAKANPDDKRAKRILQLHGM